MFIRARLKSTKFGLRNSVAFSFIIINILTSFFFYSSTFDTVTNSLNTEWERTKELSLESVKGMIKEDAVSGNYPSILGKLENLVSSHEIKGASFKSGFGDVSFTVGKPEKNYEGVHKIIYYESNSDPVGSITIYFDDEPLISAIQSIQAKIILYSAVVFLVNLFLLNLFSKLVLSPIMQITTGVIQGDPQALKNLKIRSFVHEFSNLQRKLNEFGISFQEHEREQKRALKNSAIAQTTQMLAHDVRKPFTLVSALVEMVTQAKSSEQVTKILKQSIPDISSSLSNVNGMIQDVMEVGKADTSLHVEPESIQGIINEVLVSSFRFNSNANIEIGSNFNHFKKAEVSRQKVSRAFANIISNAVEHMNGKGEIWFKTKDKQGMIEICIGNSNSFIEPEDREQLFDAFFTKDKQGGTGLGLAIAKKVVDAHGGKIWCESSKTRGTEFFFTLPASDQPDLSGTEILCSSQAYFDKGSIQLELDESGVSSFRDSHTSEQEDLIESALIAKLDAPLNIAIIDDESLYISHLRFHLESSELLKRLNIEDFFCAEDFLADLVSKKFDVVIVDVDLGKGKMNGFEAVSLIRQMASTSKICVHSNRGVLEYQPQALSAGADIFLPKPMTRLHILKILASSIGLTEEVANAANTKHQTEMFSGKILLVEDNSTITQSWQLYFSEGEDLEVFMTFEDFLMKSGKQEFFEDVQAVVTDYYLNDSFTGIDVANRLDSLGVRVPLYLSTNKDSVEDSEKTLFKALLPKNPKQAVTKLRHHELGVQEQQETGTMGLAKFKESLRQKSLLIVEDETTQREMYCEEGSSLMDCDGAASFEEAITLLNSKKYDYLLSDVHLTKSYDDPSDGLKVMSAAKRTNPNISVVAMSTDDSVPRIESMDHFVAKPLLDSDQIAVALLKADEVRA